MRFSLLAVGVILMSTNAYANTNLGQQLSICAAKTDKLERLICYDELAANAKPSAHIMTPTPPKVVAVKPTVAAAAHAPVETIDTFGLTKKPVEKIAKIYAEITTIKKAPHGEFIITLSNGQVWKQSSAERYTIKKGQRVFIKTGAFGSFLLGTDGRNAMTRVKRLK